MGYLRRHATTFQNTLRRVFGARLLASQRVFQSPLVELIEHQSSICERLFLRCPVRFENESWQTFNFVLTQLTEQPLSPQQCIAMANVYDTGL